MLYLAVSDTVIEVDSQPTTVHVIVYTTYPIMHETPVFRDATIFRIWRGKSPSDLFFKTSIKCTVNYTLCDFKYCCIIIDTHS